MDKEFLKKKDVCKKMAAESVIFRVVSEDLPKFIESLDQLEYNQTTENLLDTVIKFFTQEKEVIVNLAINK